MGFISVFQKQKSYKDVGDIEIKCNKKSGMGLCDPFTQLRPSLAWLLKMFCGVEVATTIWFIADPTETPPHLGDTAQESIKGNTNIYIFDSLSTYSLPRFHNRCVSKVMLPFHSTIHGYVVITHWMHDIIYFHPIYLLTQTISISIFLHSPWMYKYAQLETVRNIFLCCPLTDVIISRNWQKRRTTQ